jgi:predicted metal-dependent hydrolase
MGSSLTIRRLQVDLDTPWPRHWAGEDAFRSAFFNALSFSFPAGEQFFIDAVRQGAQCLDGPARAAMEAEIRDFAGQEATHRRIHERFNAQLAAQGYVNRWEGRIRRRIERELRGVDPRIWVGVTAATEHFTAMFADYLLTHPQVLDGAPPRLRDLWLWHASEESEHRATAFELYRAIGGDELWRRRLFKVVTLHFATDLARQTLHNLWRDGHWWRPATWAGAWRLLAARDGLLRFLWRPWRRYLAPDFHPHEGDRTPGARWLSTHAEMAPPVRTTS